MLRAASVSLDFHSAGEVAGRYIDQLEEGRFNQAQCILCFLEESLPQMVEDERCIHRVGWIRCSVRAEH